MTTRSTLARFLLPAGALLLSASAGLALAQPATQPAPAGAQASADMPSGRELFDRYIEVTGGRPAREKITNRRVSAVLEIPMQQIRAPMTILQADAGRIRVLSDIPGMGKSEQGSDGNIVWANDVTTGPRILTGAEREQFLRGSSLRMELEPEKFFTDMKTTKVETINGKPAYEVEMTTTAGQVMRAYFDKESGLMVMQRMTTSSPMGELPIESTSEDFREVDGVKMPFLTRQRITAQGMNIEMLIRTEKVEHNLDLPADAFALPPEVKALADKQPPAPAPAPVTPKPN